MNLAVREGDWKLICDFDGTAAELYNVVQDPSESNNLAETYPELAQRLVRQVTEWYATISH